MILPTLYKQAKTDKIQEWTVGTIGEEIVTRHGALNGKLQEKRKKAKGKNIGKKNETTPEQQACFEAKSMWIKKKDKGYFETIEEAKSEVVFLPMLANDIKKFSDKKKEQIFSQPFYTQPKMDGVRCLAYWEGDKVKLLSRGGKEYSLPHISEQVSHVLAPDQVFDGELYIDGLIRQDIQALVKKWRDEEYEETGYSSNDVELWVYDSFFIGKEKETFETRINYLELLDTSINLSAKPIENIKVVSSFGFTGDLKKGLTEKLVMDAHNNYVLMGFEGTIIRLATGPYELGHRSQSLLKYKDFQDDEFEIIGYKEDVDGCVLWQVKVSDEVTCDVTPKGSKESRKKLLKKADKYIGQLLTVKYQGYTKDGNLEFPVGLAIRLPEDM